MMQDANWVDTDGHVTRDTNDDEWTADCCLCSLCSASSGAVIQRSFLLRIFPRGKRHGSCPVGHARLRCGNRPICAHAHNRLLYMMLGAFRAVICRHIQRVRDLLWPLRDPVVVVKLINASLERDNSNSRRTNYNRTVATLGKLSIDDEDDRQASRRTTPFCALVFWASGVVLWS